MPSAKHNSTMQRATGLIPSLLKVTSSRDVPFHQPKHLHSMHHGFVLLCILFLPHYHIGVDLRWVCHGFSVIIRLAYYQSSWIGCRWIFCTVLCLWHCITGGTKLELKHNCDYTIRQLIIGVHSFVTLYNGWSIQMYMYFSYFSKFITVGNT